MTVIVDALITSHPERRIFEDLRQGNVGCVTVTCGVWDDAGEALDHLGQWRDAVQANADLVALARSRTGIDAVIASGRTAIILGFQNTDQFEGRIRYIELFAELGVRVVQLTYNNQNAIGGSCYEPHDSGLARFGQEVVREMNRVGMLIDLSHVGERTGLEVIAASARPVAVTHANPASRYPHQRNKSDQLLRALAERGGVVGCALYSNITGGPETTLEQWVDMVAWTVGLIGIDHVGFGSDKSVNGTLADLHWMRMGRWTRSVDYGAGSASNPGKTPGFEWFQSMADYPAVIEGLRRKGFSAAEIDKIGHGNWLRVYGEVFGGDE